MTDEERRAADLENMQRRDQLNRDIAILKQKLEKASQEIMQLGQELSRNPSTVRPSVREHGFELTKKGVSVTVNFEAVKGWVAELQKAEDELVSVNAVLEPGIIRQTLHSPS